MYVCQISFICAEIRIYSIQIHIIHIKLSQHIEKIMVLVIRMKHRCTVLNLIYQKLPNITWELN